jgi:hypothetical protein
MADTYLVVGGYTFTGFGVPERINGGGAQQLKVHTMLGGNRVVDALGPNDDAIRFTGRFREASAMQQVALMDAMRIAGAPVTLTYWNLSYTVVISKFTWSFERFYEVPYELECTVVVDQAQSAPQAAPTLDSSVTQSIRVASQTAGGSTAVNAAIAPISSQYSTYGPLSTATPTGQGQVQSATSNSLTTLYPIASAADIPSAPAGNVTAGGNPSAMASSLTTQTQTMTDGAAAQNTIPPVQAINSNIMATGGGLQ